ncbi:hypothetical protein BYT27DRAFT_7216816 [Phlegmacium glaucopus]|nr:hypothetical protein BYT27DRAFT_7216816 [Phlegmacium glaucopus]
MGETGAGIVYEEDIDMDLNNSLTQSWAAIKEKCPWFFKLKAIIDERPSVVPVGVGNNNSGYDVSILAPSENTSEFDWSDPGLGLDTIDAIADSDGIGEGDGEGGNGDYGGNGSDDGGDSEIEDAAVEKKILTTKLKAPTVIKCKAAPTETPETKMLKTSARAGKLTPISAITAKEEETTQKVLDLKKLKVKGETEKVLAKIKAKADLKMQQMKLRAELMQKKMDNEFRLQMARMGHSQIGHTYNAGSGSAVHSNAAASGSGYSDTGSVTPSAYSSELPQLDPSLDFFGPNSGYDFNQHLQD